MNDRLDAAVMDALDRMVAETPALGPTPSLADSADRTPDRAGERPRRVWLVSAAAITALVIAAGTVIANRSSDDGGHRSSTPSTGDDEPAGDLGAARLAVAPGVADYYLGPDSLGEPHVDLELFEALVRCTAMDESGACTGIEGIAGVPLVVYGQDVTSPGDSTLPDGDGDAVSVGTTFTTVSPIDYAWGSTPVPEHAVVRGHDAVVYGGVGDGRTAVWQERDGVLVWVTVSESRSDELLTIAEEVRRVAGPATIPARLVVPGTAGAPFGTGSNNSGGLVLDRTTGRECIGFRFVDDCPDGISTLTWVDTRTDSTPVGFAVVGATSNGVSSVRVRTPTGGDVTAETFAFGASEWRFFRVDVEPSLAISIEWLDPSGGVVDQTDDLRNGNGYAEPIAVSVIDASGMAGAGDRLAELMTGSFDGQAVTIDGNTPSAVRDLAAETERTVVLYDIGYLPGFIPPAASILAGLLGDADVQQASLDVSETLNELDNCPGPRTECASDRLVVVLGRDHAGEWAPSEATSSPPTTAAE